MKSSSLPQARVIRLADLDRRDGGQPPHAEVVSRHPQAIGSTIPGGLADLAPPKRGSDRPATAPAEPAGDQASRPGAVPRAKRRARRGPPRDVPRLPRGVVQHWPVQLHATGRGYARVWLGNALLMLCTLGLAWPWAHRRSMRYFLQHTELAGHQLGFELSDRLLWPRLGMTAALWLGLLAASMGSFWTGMLALTVGSLVWPLVVYLQIHHQVGAITWAGRALWFDGAWPHFLRLTSLPVALWLGAVWSVALAWRQGVHQAWPVAVACVLVWLACLPMALKAFYGFRQQHVRLGPLRLKWQALWRDFAQALSRAAWWAGLWSALVLGGALLGLAGWLAWRHRVPPLALSAGALLLGSILLSIWWPTMDAALAKVVWRRSGNRYVRFVDHTPERAHGRLVLKNALRLVLTLGAYWPWAVVSSRRMRWTHMEVLSRVDPEVLIQYWGLQDPATEVPAPENEVILAAGAMAGVRSAA